MEFGCHKLYIRGKLEDAVSGKRHEVNRPANDEQTAEAVAFIQFVMEEEEIVDL